MRRQGNPFLCANIVVVSTDLEGTASDEDGNFSIENVEVGSKLSVSAIGYETLNQFADNQEISFCTRTFMMKCQV